MILLQLSAAQGPVECCLAVAKALRVLLREAEHLNLEVRMLEKENGPEKGTLKSVLLSVDGVEASEFAQSWHGTIQWRCKSLFRPSHKRKNWFIGGIFSEQKEIISSADIRFETFRSSGPGGQHANKTESAVRATHLATGISVKVQSERSQHANKRLAKALIQHKLATLEKENFDSERGERRKNHHQVERGRPIRVFTGKRFLEDIIEEKTWEENSVS